MFEQQCNAVAKFITLYTVFFHCNMPLNDRSFYLFYRLVQLCYVTVQSARPLWNSHTLEMYCNLTMMTFVNTWEQLKICGSSDI